MVIQALEHSAMPSKISMYHSTIIGYLTIPLTIERQDHMLLFILASANFALAHIWDYAAVLRVERNIPIMFGQKPTKL